MKLIVSSFFTGMHNNYTNVIKCIGSNTFPYDAVYDEMGEVDVYYSNPRPQTKDISPHDAQCALHMITACQQSGKSHINYKEIRAWPEFFQVDKRLA